MEDREVLAHKMMSGLVRSMVSSLVDQPDRVRIGMNHEDSGLVFNVTVAIGDLGKVIGKQGRMARCLRTIVGAAGQKARIPCRLNISEQTR